MFSRVQQPWSKWRFFAAYWVLQLVLGFFLWPLLAGDSISLSNLTAGFRDWGYTLGFGSVAGALVAVQAAFLIPVRAPREGSGSVISRFGRCTLAGFAAGLLIACIIVMAFAALGAVGLEFPRGLSDFFDPPWRFWLIVAGAGVPCTIWLMLRTRKRSSVHLSLAIATFGAGLLSLAIPWVVYSVYQTLLNRGAADRPFALAGIGAVGLTWIIATPLLIRFSRRVPVEDALGRIAARLFLGTVIEAAAVIPIDVMVRRKSQCYCAEGTLWTLTLCWGMGAVFLGPAIWLIPLARRRRRWLAGHCDVCDYDMSACMGAERCPECGSGWRARPPSAGSPPRPS
jgi:hypothetical protein